MVTGGFPQWRTIGGTLYRTMDFFSEAVEKAPYQSGI
jgi:hypothetical protein